MKGVVATILRIVTACYFLAALAGCRDESAPGPRTPSLPPSYTVTSDKAVYNPGESVEILVSPATTAPVAVRIKHLGKVIEEMMVSGTSFNWDPPAADFKGYMVELFEPEADGTPTNVLATIGIDVSSDWTRFPRYGFVSKFPEMTDAQVDEVIGNLNRYRINGIQYYDWHYKHHQPLAGTPENPTPVYRDIINREIYFSTVKKYIHAGHSRNIRAMFYNLVYGVLKDSGLKEEWYIYTSAARVEKDKHPLPPPFISDIFLVDPSNPEWQQYLIGQNRNVYAALPFDGFHMDQLGDRGTRYDHHGAPTDLSLGFRSFIEAIESDMPEKVNVLNAVNQFGQASIAQAPVDFLYTEVWSPNDTYSDLASVILQNNTLSDQQLNTVLAAYVNYDLADDVGHFNTASVLMADAVIFAFGGAHLELGEHMLGKEYFPNDNLAMREDLKRYLVSYYDFLVAYQNLLRDGGNFNTPSIISADNKVQFSAWPPSPGKVAVVGKEHEHRQILHLLNFTNAKTMQWRDNTGIQAVPIAVEDIQVRFTPERPVAKVWYASPDFHKGASIEIDFKVTGNQLSMTLPGLQYWSMIVIEYQH